MEKGTKCVMNNDCDVYGGSQGKELEFFRMGTDYKDNDIYCFNDDMIRLYRHEFDILEEKSQSDLIDEIIEDDKKEELLEFIRSNRDSILDILFDREK